MLLLAEQVALAADPEVLLGEFEAVGLLLEGDEPLRRRLGGVEDDAVGLLGAPPDAAPQLMELGKAETLGVFDDHHGRVGDVDPHLDDGGRDEEARVPGEEAPHRLVLLR